MIKCISVDGPDGSGKSTLIANLCDIYNVIMLPRFYSMGMVPADSEERKLWFRNSNAVDTTRIYMSGHKLRLLVAESFKRGNHYKLLEKNSKESLIAIDRGALSVRAFSFAALKKDTDMTDEQIDAHIYKEFDKDFRKKSDQIVDMSILLFDDGSLEEVISRRIYDKEDELLARYQHEYYCKHQIREENVRLILPTLSEEEVLEKTINYIENMEG